MGLAWGAFSAASAAALAATGRFMFPNVLNEPPQQFRAGFPNEYGQGVDERWKEKFGVWIVRTNEDIEQHVSGFYALFTICTVSLRWLLMASSPSTVLLRNCRPPIHTKSRALSFT